MRAVIFANGSLEQAPALLPDDLIIAADGGGLHCLRLGIVPHTVIGDLDSLSPADVETLRSQGAGIIQYPTHKDYTDLELAVQFAEERGASEAVLFGALGQRWDQTLANLLLPVRLTGLRLSLQDGQQEMFVIRPGQAASIHAPHGSTVSLIPLAGDAHGVSTRGLEYPLRDESLLFGATRGVSNVLLEDPAQVSLSLGLLMCIVIRKDIA